MLNQIKSHQLVEIEYGGEPYTFYPLGEHVVIAPGVCGGRPTFKFTRLEVSVILAQLANGESIDEIVADYADTDLTREAVQEALRLADVALLQTGQSLYPTAV